MAWLNRKGLTSKSWLLFTSSIDLGNCLNVIIDLPGSQSVVRLHCKQRGGGNDRVRIEVKQIQSCKEVA